MERLNVLWTTNSVETVESFLALYAGNSLKKGWWDEVHIIIWGSSTKAIGEDPKMQELVKEMLNNGVTMEACKHCSDRYNASEVLVKLGVEVKYMGEPLTKYIKSGANLITL